MQVSLEYKEWIEEEEEEEEGGESEKIYTAKIYIWLSTADEHNNAIKKVWALGKVYRITALDIHRHGISCRYETSDTAILKDVLTKFFGVE